MVAATTLDSDIFLRLWSRQKMTATLAKHLLRLSFDDQETKRMSELSEKNQDGTITPEELEEFDQFVRVGMVLSIMQSRARQQLKRAIKKTEH